MEKKTMPPTLKALGVAKRLAMIEELKKFTTDRKLEHVEKLIEELDLEAKQICTGEYIPEELLNIMVQEEFQIMQRKNAEAQMSEKPEDHVIRGHRRIE